jgi:hypothetical protein
MHYTLNEKNGVLLLGKMDETFQQLIHPGLAASDKLACWL